jgi:hypothetical protein
VAFLPDKDQHLYTNMTAFVTYFHYVTAPEARRSDALSPSMFLFHPWLLNALRLSKRLGMELYPATKSAAHCKPIDVARGQRRHGSAAAEDGCTD